MTKSRGIRAKRGTRIEWATEQEGKHHCGCGCGQVIQVRPEHYPRVPLFVHSHNSKLQQKSQPPEAKPCACRCGLNARPGRDYISGHNSAVRTHTQATRDKMSQSQAARLAAQPAPRKPVNPGSPCGCGCGQEARPGRRFVTGHNTRGTRMTNYRGWYKSGQYIRVHAEDHPYACDGYVLQHRLVAEQHLRTSDPDSPYLIRLGNQRYLRPEVVVHHIDGVKDHNEVENLQAMSVDEHTKLHHGQGDIHHH